MATRAQSIMIWKNANLALAFTDHCDRFVAKLEMDMAMDTSDFLIWCELPGANTLPIFADLEEAIAAGVNWLESNAGRAGCKLEELEVESFVATLKYELKGMVLQRLRSKGMAPDSKNLTPVNQPSAPIARTG